MDKLISRLGEHYGDPSLTETQLSDVISELLDTGKTEDEILSEFDSDEVANILASYGDPEDEDAVVESSTEPDNEAEVVDTTDGVDKDEEQTIIDMINALSPEKKEAVLGRIHGDRLNGIGTAAPIEKDTDSPNDVNVPKSGNALAKLIDSLRF
jgi:uncharacterized protein (DUF433 family)